MTEWELLTKPLQWCYTRPGSKPLQWRLCSSCVTHHNSKSNLIGPKQQLSLSLCVPTVSLFLPFSFPLLFFPTLSLSISSTSFCLFYLFLYFSHSLCCFFFIIIIFLSRYISVALFVTAIQTQEKKILWMFNLIHEKWEYSFCTRGSCDAVRL